MADNKFFITEDNAQKFISLEGLNYFWDRAKAYVDGVDSELTDEIDSLKSVVGDETKGLIKDFNDLKAYTESLGDIEGGEGLGGMIDSKIAALDLPNTYAGKKATEDAIAGAVETANGYTNSTVEAAVKGLKDNELAALGERIDNVVADAKSYSVVAVTGEDLAALGENVKEAFKLVDEDNTQCGDVIKVYKDSALQGVELNEQNLVFTYLLANGTESVVSIDVSKFLAESEFADGLEVVDGVVSVKVDTASESFLSVGENGLKVSGIADAIAAAAQSLKDNEIKANADAIDALSSQVAQDLAGAVATLESKIETDIETAVNSLKNNEIKANADAITALGVTVGENTAAIGVNAAAISALESKVAADLETALATAKSYTDDLFNSIVFASNDDIDGVFETVTE